MVGTAAAGYPRRGMHFKKYSFIGEPHKSDMTPIKLPSFHRVSAEWFYGLRLWPLQQASYWGIDERCANSVASPRHDTSTYKLTISTTFSSDDLITDFHAKYDTSVIRAFVLWSSDATEKQESTDYARLTLNNKDSMSTILLPFYDSAFVLFCLTRKWS